MLDDLKMIHERDAQDALGIAEKQCQQLNHEFDPIADFNINQIDTIVYCGMAGSALAALYAQTWPLARPFELVRQYEIPGYVGNRTLFIAASYSGNSEETLAGLAQAEAQGAQIVVLSGGGKLAEIAQQKNYPLLLIPKVEQPRFAALYTLKALLVLFKQTGLVLEYKTELMQAALFLKDSVQEWLPTVPTKDNIAKQIALECIGKSVVIYGGPKMFPAAYKWKTGFNENAKQVAWASQLPEASHNEFLGWTKQPVSKPYTIIDLRSNFEDKRVQNRFVMAERALSGMRPASLVVSVKGETLVSQQLWAANLGDFVTIYTALLNGVNPTPTNMMKKFKLATEQDNG
jgi:glucose/mannose-6-phosphate isomerase